MLNQFRVYWVKNNQGMTVLHTNGPTTAIQPNFYGTGSTEYDNIISDATITTSANTERNLDALSDGVIKSTRTISTVTLKNTSSKTHKT